MTEPTGRDGHAGTPLPELPDRTAVDLAALRARVDHPVLGAVLATLLARSCDADGGLVAYHEDSPGVER
ncbi:YxD-tail cyclophane-containing RiPP peptide [Streptomyces sp. NPDC002817]|uniref:YxD-tail cyclophane-containing RiPP peptide n=1 Tax=Streptomyces sp. NPDC088357 TaxID=3154655 RepID=UPI003447EF5E